MMQRILLVSMKLGAGNCSASIGWHLGVIVDVAGSRRAALAALCHREYIVLVIDQSMQESDPCGVELLWQAAGTAIPVELNLGISGYNRVLREVRAALQRWGREQSLADEAALRLVAGNLKSTLTGLILKSQLILEEPTLVPEVVLKLRRVVELASELRYQIERY